MSLDQPSTSAIELTRQLSVWFSDNAVPKQYMIEKTLASPSGAFAYRFRHRVRMSANRPMVNLVIDLQESRRWCETRFGPSAYLFSVDKDWNIIKPGIVATELSIWDTSRAWVAHGQSFFFHDTNHAMEFKLAWA